MKCDRFVGSGIANDRGLRSTISNTGSYQSSDAGSRHYSSKQKRCVDLLSKRDAYKKVLSRSETVGVSKKDVITRVSFRESPVTLTMDAFTEIYTSKNEPRDVKKCKSCTSLNQVKYNEVITIINDSH